MKKKDLTYALLAVIILLVAGYVAVTQLMPKNAATSSGVQVEKVGIIPARLDESGLTALGTATDYSSAVDLNGLGNTAPFGH